MTKVSVTGPKKELQTVIEELHNLELLHIDEYEGELETGDPLEGANELSQVLVDVRSLLSKLPEVEDYSDGELDLEHVDEEIDNIKYRVESIEENIADLEKERSNLEEQRKFYSKLQGTDLNVEDLEGTETLDVFVGRLDKDELKRKTSSAYELFEGENAIVVFYHDDSVRKVIDDIKEEEIRVIESEFQGQISEVVDKISTRKQGIEEEEEGLQNELEVVSREWRSRLEETEAFLTQKVEKSEAPIKFGTMKRSFLAEGWVPTGRLQDFKDTLNQVTSGKIHVETEEDIEQPPVKHKNNKAVQPFESLTDMMAVPKYNEIDPSFLILLTFPLFFGLMIGDAGYGITSAIVFFAGMKKFPQAAQIFKALLWTSAATLLFGLLYGEMFGFQIYESPFYRADWWTEIFYLTLGIGVAHVNLGLLIGAYNEYMHHGLMEAIFAKISWMFLQIAIVAGYLASTIYGMNAGLMVGLGITAPTLLMLYKGEGVEGIVEIPSLLSNVLSYLRLFGVCIAAYSLAGTANAIAAPAYASGTLIGIAGGTLILIVAHTMLTFVKIIEGFLQGIRLHYVEMFGWFYEGGGTKYAPFGARKKN